MKAEEKKNLSGGASYRHLVHRRRYLCEETRTNGGITIQ